MSDAPELPHDLLELAPETALAFDGAPPWWATASLERAPFVVVRRAPERGGRIAVGVRGTRRSERAAAWLDRRRVVRRIRPEDLVAGRSWRAHTRAPQLAALEEVAEAMARQRLSWGPTGSAGFQLATGVPCLDVASDLDVVVRAAQGISPPEARRLLTALARLPVSVDVQVETAAGAIALAEVASGAPRIVLRTQHGPVLVAAPWARDPNAAPA